MSTPSNRVPFTIPTKADPEFAALHGAARRKVRAWAQRYALVWNERPITGALLRLAKRTGASYTTVVRNYYKLRAEPDWRTLIDRSMVQLTPLTVRLPMPASGLCVKILRRQADEVWLQIMPVEKAASASGAPKADRR